MTSKDKQARIISELKAAGIANVTTLRLEAKKVYEQINDDEHIKGAIRGRYKGDGAMFIATDQRMILLNYKPLFHTNEEISYLVLAGVTYNSQGPFAGVTVHTRMGDFPFTFVRKASAQKLVEYLEKKHIDSSVIANGNRLKTVAEPTIMTSETRIFLTSHNLGVLSSINPDGGVNGAAMYYVLGPDVLLYLVTRQETTKAHNIKRKSSVAFTVCDESLRSTAQIRGTATLETSPQKIDEIMQKIIRPHIYNKEFAWPPLTQLTAGAYQVLKISPTEVKFHKFG